MNRQFDPQDVGVIYPSVGNKTLPLTVLRWSATKRATEIALQDFLGGLVYEAPVVIAHGKVFQVLLGHAQVQMLRDLGQAQAVCVVITPSAVSLKDHGCGEQAVKTGTERGAR
jgi:hypothetical protein